MTQAGGTQPDPAADGFRDRCRELGLPAWQVDHDGRITQRPDLPDPAAALLHHTAFERLIETTAQAVLEAPQAETQTAAPGCHLIPVLDQRGPRRCGGHLVLVLQPAALQTGWFTGVCQEADTDPRRAADELRTALPTLDPSRGQDLEQLATMLRWTHHDLQQQAEDRKSIDEFCHRLMQSYEEVNLIYRLSASMKCLPDPREMMNTTCGDLHDVLAFGWTAAVFTDTDAGQLAPDLLGAVVTTGDLPMPRPKLRNHARAMLARPREQWEDVTLIRAGELFDVTGSETVAVPIYLGEAVAGVLLAGDKAGTGEDQEVCSAETKMLRASADFLSVFLENAAAFHRQKALFMGTLQALTATIDAKDEYTRGHSERVALLARQLALAEGMTEQEAGTVHVAGLMHDVGKIGVPGHVLGKVGRLTDEEFDQVKQHPVIGHRILKDIPQLHDMLDGVLHHHERYDGRGYPAGLAGKQIPMLGRLLAVCDTFDAMSSHRAYRDAMPREQVLAELRRAAGTQLDPQFVEAFMRIDLGAYDAALAVHETKERRAA